MTPTFTSLDDVRLPGAPDASLSLDGAPLRILDTSDTDEHQIVDSVEISAAVGIATVLYKWCPDALFALLDENHWLSFTWLLTLPDETKIEIGRIRDQVTFGTLDKEGLWKLMVTYNTPRSYGETAAGDKTKCEGRWIPNTVETMLDGQDISDSVEVDRLGRAFVRDLIFHRKWLTGRATKHEFFVESAHLGGMDPFADGIAMNPHWLYSSFDVARCTRCGNADVEGRSLNRCGKCGTAAYCCSGCQKEDWPVHKAVCSMSMEERGKALHLTKDGGLIYWSRKDENALPEDQFSGLLYSYNLTQ
nr:n-lysine methyltransferase smyd2-a [Quercus suber]